MKTLLVCLVLVSMICLMGCQSETKINGRDVSCVGVLDEKNPEYKYEASDWNIGVGLLSILTVVGILPAVWIGLKRAWCPISQNTTSLPAMDLSETGTEASSY